MKNKWNESEGKAYFTGEPTTAALKVSFFGPFYGGYNVIKLDDKYQYALVSGPNHVTTCGFYRAPAPFRMR